MLNQLNLMGLGMSSDPPAIVLPMAHGSHDLRGFVCCGTLQVDITLGFDITYSRRQEFTSRIFANKDRINESAAFLQQAAWLQGRVALCMLRLHNSYLIRVQSTYPRHCELWINQSLRQIMTSQITTFVWKAGASTILAIRTEACNCQKSTCVYSTSHASDSVIICLAMPCM